MRWDEQGWNKYGPAIMLDIRAGVDDKGNITAYEAVAFAQAGAGTSAARQLTGVEAFAAEGASARTRRTWRRCTRWLRRAAV
jgi:hypothetical protein